MSREEIVKNMISFIEDIERDLQAAKLAGGSRAARMDVVNAILKELERETKDED